MEWSIELADTFIETEELGSRGTGNSVLWGAARECQLIEYSLIAAGERVLAYIGLSQRIGGHIAYMENLAVIVDIRKVSRLLASEGSLQGSR